MRLGGLALFALCAGAPLAAQSDPVEIVRHVARQVAEEMRQIDALLRQAEQPADVEDRLDDARFRQSRVVRGIEDLLTALHDIECTCPGGT